MKSPIIAILATLALASIVAMAAGPITIDIVARDNDSAVTTRVVRVKQAARPALTLWLDEQGLPGNPLRQIGKMSADILAPYITNNVDGRVLIKARAAATESVVVEGSGE